MDSGQLDRREFIVRTGFLTGVLATGSALSLLAPTRAWAADLNALTTVEGTTLMAVTRTIAPHDTLEDPAYALVIKAIDAECARDPANLALVREGLEGLGTAFAASPEPARVKALAALETSPFFKFVRYQTLFNLYASPLAYAHFGYEGEAFSKGGYLLRGFNDLRWLPEVPVADAGPAP